jgi:hypothetical protein
MKKVVCTASVVAVIAGVAMTSEVRAGEPAEWILTNCQGGKPLSGVSCDLKNTKKGQCLVQSRKTGQADWDFAPCGGAKTKIVAKSDGPIKCGEPVKLQLGDEFYRKCRDPQKVGINICSDDADKPAPSGIDHFTWQLTGCTGEVNADSPISLYNTQRKDSVVFATRPSIVVDTCWADKVKFGKCITVRDN